MLIFNIYISKVNKWNVDYINNYSGWLTCSRNSLPGLKCGTYLPFKLTDSPVLGLRPTLGFRKCSEKLPKPRISIRLPLASSWLIFSSKPFTANSTSLRSRCLWLRDKDSIKSDFVRLLSALDLSVIPIYLTGGPSLAAPCCVEDSVSCLLYL